MLVSLGSCSDVRTIRIGTRKSQLALAQTEIFAESLKASYPSLKFEIIGLETVGDKILNVALSKIGDKGLFTKDLENKLLQKELDLVVHSLKDIPTQLPDGLVLGCILDRVFSNDVVIMNESNRGQTLENLPAGSVIGTSALRRVAFLRRRYPALNFIDIRGNLNTRLAKLDGKFDFQPGKETKYDAIVLAEAGVRRLGWDYRIDQILKDMPYAVSQGALTCECRENDLEILRLLASVHCETSALTSIAERSLLRTLDGGCSTAVGIKSEPTPGSHQIGKISYLTLTASVLSLDGKVEVKHAFAVNLPFRVDDCKDLGERKYLNLNYDGPLELIQMSYDENDFGIIKSKQSIFMGLNIQPICDIGRARLLTASKLGKELAIYLMNNGADEILKESKKLTKESGRLDPNEIKTLIDSYKPSDNLKNESF